MVKIPRPYEVERVKIIKQEDNLALHVKRSDDKISNRTVGLYEHDEIIKYYFDTVIMPRVEEQGKPFNVPVFYSSPEKWKSIQNDGFIRDERNKIMVPLITYKRSSTVKNRQLSRNLFPDNPHLYETFEVVYSERNRYSLFASHVKIAKEKELYNVIIPDYVILTYDCIIWTDQISQMNKLTEAILYAESTYWGNDRFKFFTKIDDMSHTYELAIGEDRAIQSTFSIVMWGYIIPDAIQKQMAQKSEKAVSISQVGLQFNIGQQTEELTASGGRYDYKTVLANELICGMTYNYNSEALLYLVGNVTKVGTVLDTDSAKFFGEYFAVAPTPLPNTSINDFDFYVNGQHVNAAMSGFSFSEQADGLLLTIDPTVNQFSLAETDEIVAVGRFQQ